MYVELPNGRKIGDHLPCYIIAEAGINHNGSFEIAKKLIDGAVSKGADAIKFQKRNIEDMYLKKYLETPYENNHSFGKTYGEHKEWLEFSDEQFFELKKYALSKGIEFLVSGFDLNGFNFIEYELDVPLHKIPSPYINHYPLLEQVAKYGKPIVLSTGMHDLQEIKDAVNFIRQYNNQIVIMQCVTKYPCEDEEVNLNVLKTFRDELSTLVGYSSHDRGVILSVASVALGACMIEKHFTLDRTMRGPDHAASVEPRGLELIHNYIRVVEKGLGNGIKTILQDEIKQKLKYGISIVAKNKISKDTILTEDLLQFKVPGGGILPKNIKNVIGKRVKKDLEEDTIIYETDIY